MLRRNVNGKRAPTVRKFSFELLYKREEMSENTR